LREYFELFKGEEVNIILPHLFSHYSDDVYLSLHLELILDFDEHIIQKFSNFHIFYSRSPYFKHFAKGLRRCIFIHGRKKDENMHYMKRSYQSVGLSCIETEHITGIAWSDVPNTIVSDTLSDGTVYIVGGYWLQSDIWTRFPVFDREHEQSANASFRDLIDVQTGISLKTTNNTNLSKSNYWMIQIRFPDKFAQIRQSHPNMTNICIGLYECEMQFSTSDMLNMIRNASGSENRPNDIRIMTNQPGYMKQILAGDTQSIRLLPCSPRVGLYELLCEMEMAVEAEFFIGSPISSIYSNIVMFRRMLNYTSIESLLHAL
jgi:hypothetical protein